MMFPRISSGRISFPVETSVLQNLLTPLSSFNFVFLNERIVIPVLILSLDLGALVLHLDYFGGTIYIS